MRLKCSAVETPQRRAARRTGCELFHDVRQLGRTQYAFQSAADSDPLFMVWAHKQADF